MREIEALVAACEKWQTRKKSLLALSKYSIAEKQAEVYGPIVDLALRLFCASLCKPKETDRIKALDSIIKHIRTPDTELAVLLGLCRLLEDPSPDIVERAARALREYVRIGKKADMTFHRVFERLSAQAIKRGVTKDAHKALTAIAKSIPRGKPLGRGPTSPKGKGVRPPPKRKRKPKPQPKQPRWRKVRIDGAVVCVSGAIYAMRRHGFDDEDQVILYRGVPSAKNQKLELSAVSETREIRSLLPLEGGWAERAEVAALDADGEVWFLGEGRLDKEDVRGPRPKRGGYPFVGHMTRLRQRGERLYALGYGGQVFVRTLDEAWRPLSSSRPTIGGFKFCFYDALPIGMETLGPVTLGPETLGTETLPPETPGTETLVCGTCIGELDRAAVAKADEDDDDEAFAQAFLDTPKNEPGLWRCDGDDWTRLTFKSDVRLAFELFESGGVPHVVLNGGAVFQLQEAGVAQVAALERLEDIEQSGGRCYVLVGEHVLEWSDGAPRDLGLPDVAGAHSISVAGSHLIAVTPNSVLQRVDEDWKTLRCWIYS